MKVVLSVNAQYIMSKLTGEGYPTWAVGGCVRDAVMGREPADWDIVTSATPGQVKTVFKGMKTIDTGIRYGTVTVIIDRVPYEVTTFRGESLREDLSRRDFTINAMAYDGSKISDFFGGQDDIEAKIIRCVGTVNDRFNEDALRIMRALRFASALDFKIEPETRTGILNNKNLLNNIAAERIRDEFLQLICGINSERVICEYSDVIFAALPRLEMLYNNFSVDTAEKLRKNAHFASLAPCTIEARLAILLSVGRSEEAVAAAKAVLQGIRLSQKRIASIMAARNAADNTSR